MEVDLSKLAESYNHMASRQHELHALIDAPHPTQQDLFQALVNLTEAQAICWEKAMAALTELAGGKWVPHE